MSYFRSLALVMLGGVFGYVLPHLMSSQSGEVKRLEQAIDQAVADSGQKGFPVFLDVTNSVGSELEGKSLHDIVMAVGGRLKDIHVDQSQSPVVVLLTTKLGRNGFGPFDERLRLEVMFDDKTGSWVVSGAYYTLVGL